MSIKARIVSDTSRFGTVGIPVELGTAQAVGITVSNYSNQWLTIGTDGMFVPPFTLGWADNFYGSSASSIQIRTGAPAGASQSPVPINGAVVVAVYDTPVAPNPGIPSQQLLSPLGFDVTASSGDPGVSLSRYVVAQSIPLDLVIPQFFTGALTNESEELQWQRGTTIVLAGKTAVAAGVLTNIQIAPDAKQQRIFKATISLSVATDVSLEYSAWGPIGSASLAAGIPVAFDYGPDGFNLNGGALAQYQALCTLACTVYWTLVIGPG